MSTTAGSPVLPAPSTLARHGLSEADWWRLWEAQDGKCGICRKPPARGGRLVIDHCHKTNKVRGLLHPLCNGKLGKVKDDQAWLAGALAYLQSPPAEQLFIHALSKAGNRRRRRRVPHK